MLDLIKAKQFYKEYIKNYDSENPKIALKIAHIFRTAEKAKKNCNKFKLIRRRYKFRRTYRNASWYRKIWTIKKI